MTGLSLRLIQPEDSELLFRIYANTRTEELSVVPWSEEQKTAFLRQQFTAQHAHYQEHYRGASFQVILLDGQAVGRLYVARWPREIRLVDIALLPEHRGRGVGTAILRELLDEGRRDGKPVTIHVERTNPALRLYERLGFRLKEDKGVYFFLERSPTGETGEVP